MVNTVSSIIYPDSMHHVKQPIYGCFRWTIMHSKVSYKKDDQKNNYHSVHVKTEK